MDSLVIIPEILPGLYPPGSDDHGLPLEPRTPPGPHIIPDDKIVPTQREELINQVLEGGSLPAPEGDIAPNQLEEETSPDREGRNPTRYSPIKSTTKAEIEAVSTKPKNKSDENKMQNKRLLKWWHEQLGHVSMHTVQHMASKGLLPSAIAKCKIPVGQACMYRMMTKKPWRTKSVPKPMSIVITNPGECVSLDQLESKTPGLLGQLKGAPTKARYKIATIFVDHVSNFTFVHLQQTTNAVETLEAKHQFESYS
jgi:hypothetical protein